MAHMLLIMISCLLVVIIVFCTGRLDWPIQSIIDRVQNGSELNAYTADKSLSEKSQQTFFSSDYQTARKRFIKSAIEAGAKLSQLSLSEIGLDNGELTIDIAWFGNPKFQVFLDYLF